MSSTIDTNLSRGFGLGGAGFARGSGKGRPRLTAGLLFDSRNGAEKRMFSAVLASRGSPAMATLIEPIPVDPDGPASAPRQRRVVRDLTYLWLAIACAVVGIGGFMGTYWLQLPAGTFRGSALLHVHGALCTAWLLFLISQSNLVTHGRVRSHRDWGLLGIALASVLTVVAIAVAIAGMNGRIAAGYGDAARSFLIVPISAITLFAGFTAAAIANVKRPEWHRRLMLVGTICLVQAAMARVFFLMATGGGPGMRPGVLPPPPVSVGAMPAFLLELLIVAGMVRDRRVIGRVHPAWIVGAVVITALELVRAPISSSQEWLGFASWLGGIAA
jgi:heme/copper-type cytochrome/quinol oxidase subunit 4